MISPDDLEQQHAVAANLLSDNKIHAYDYGQIAVRLAAEWIKLDDLDQAASLVAGLPAGYVDVALPQQMLADVEFAAIVHGVASALHALVTASDADAEEAQVDMLLLRGVVGRA